MRQGVPLTECSGLLFHHIGVATKSIEKEMLFYRLLGYECESTYFEDPQQGICGVFLAAEGAPRLELLENLEEQHTLDPWLERGQKFYHVAYHVIDIESAMAFFLANRAKVVAPLKQSTFFKKRICFLMLPNRLLVELIESCGQ